MNVTKYQMYVMVMVIVRIEKAASLVHVTRDLADLHVPQVSGFQKNCKKYILTPLSTF